MRLVRDLSHRRLSAGSVVTIGNFDGVHRGHRTLLQQCLALADGRLETAVVSFDPLPREWFAPASAPARLYRSRDKLALLAEAGMDLAWLMRFNDRLAAVRADEFVADFLAGGLAARHVVIGDDFRFGYRREGDFDRMRQLGRAHGFQVHAMDTLAQDGERVSSTAVRAALAASDFERAARLLGRRYRMAGRVVRGAQLGRQLGYPTANVRPPSPRVPLHGVFAVRSRLAGGPWMPGMANLGARPAVGGGETLLEVHLFDTEQSLYGQRLETEFVRKLRDEANFDGLDALVAQIRQDEREARVALAEDLANRQRQ